MLNTSYYLLIIINLLVHKIIFSYELQINSVMLVINTIPGFNFYIEY